MQRFVGAIGHGDEVIDAECLAASVAMELVAAGAEHLAAGGGGTGANFEEGIAAIFVVFDWKALEKRVAGGAGSGGELAFHISIIAKPPVAVKCLLRRKAQAG
jgi:hypothetical protein